eukprot:4395098-Amphidinium_carterae.1
MSVACLEEESHETEGQARQRVEGPRCRDQQARRVGAPCATIGAIPSHNHIIQDESSYWIHSAGTSLVNSSACGIMQRCPIVV